MKASIQQIEYYLPEAVLTSQDRALQFPDRQAASIEDKVGISKSHIAAESECASNLAFAASKLFDTCPVRPDNIDYPPLCTQSPDTPPTNACILQDHLTIPRTAGALDFNQGCFGFVYGLGLAKGLIETGQAAHDLVSVVAEVGNFY
jgi:3-oxoacyl-[acyl-carrier-protein] synthase-3